MKQLFELGQLMATPGAQQALDVLTLTFLVARHHAGDWGDLDAHDKAANNRAVREGSRILSAYQVGDTKLWIITEADRSATTILLPDEY